jgi:hypothetical protein
MQANINAVTRSIQRGKDRLDNNKSLWNMLVDDEYDDDGDYNDNGSDNDDTLILFMVTSPLSQERLLQSSSSFIYDSSFTLFDPPRLQQPYD